MCRRAPRMGPVRASADVRRACFVPMLLNGGCGYEDLRLLSPVAVHGRVRPHVRSHQQRSPQRPGHLPPYDIERTGEENYRISLALAGFAAEQVTVTAQQNRLTVAGRKGDNGKQDYIFQSIATRPFERHFSLADHVEVERATFKNGLLQIDLVRRVPEAMKPRRIEIGVGHDVAKMARSLDARDPQSRPAVKAA
jgi:molecular chaperone IbpA